MENNRVKKVVFETEDGKLEFSGQSVLFVEDEMTASEKMVHGECSKVFGTVQCTPEFLANVTESLLATLLKKAPGLDLAVILKHLGSDNSSSIKSVLENILD